MRQMFSLEGDIAVVTGVLGKLGPIWTEALLEAGASVMALDHPDAGITEDFQRFQARFGEAGLKLVRADVRDRPGLEQACNDCLKTFGPPTVLVNNAGIDRPPGSGAEGHRLEDQIGVWKESSSGSLWSSSY